MMDLIATFFAVAGCLLFYKARTAGKLATQLRFLTRMGASLCLLGSLAVFLVSYSSVKAAFIWLGAISLVGTLVVMLAGAQKRPSS